MNKGLNKNPNPKAIIRLFALLLLMLMIVPLAGCNRGKSVLAGTWVPVANSDSPPRNFPDMLVLLKDGSGIGNRNMAISWKTEKKRVIFSSTIGEALIYDYKVSDSTLILTNDERLSVAYTKQN